MMYTADAAEAFNSLLNCIHAVHVSEDPDRIQMDTGIEERRCNPPCSSHSIFHLDMYEQIKCDCGATDGKPYNYETFSYSVYTNSLLHLSSQTKREPYEISLPKILKLDYQQPLKLCPDDADIDDEELKNDVDGRLQAELCRDKNSRRNFFLLNTPEVFTFNLAWGHSNPYNDEIYRILAMIPFNFSTREIFDESPNKPEAHYLIKGIVSYSGCHYVSYFREENGGSWIKYDDHIHKKIDFWEDLIIDMYECHYHPTLVFYELTPKVPTRAQLSKLQVLFTFRTEVWRRMARNALTKDKIRREEEEIEKQLRETSLKEQKDEEAKTKGGSVKDKTDTTASAVQDKRSESPKKAGTKSNSGKKGMTTEEVQNENTPKTKLTSEQLMADAKNPLANSPSELTDRKESDLRSSTEISGEEMSPERIQSGKGDDTAGWPCQNCGKPNSFSTYKCAHCGETDMDLYDQLRYPQTVQKQLQGFQAEKSSGKW
eukprot:CAMPEP_0115009476 /NCGR_PEP_ID=MMETSP0216-20121206/22644_1 /TAXON_ID=223996 /ORGANISM="Protocruzia adherens, Strain Boccale" /LENGTH=485 /DNA_ID=CAMNT_0002377309 /DNA_START=570 /DNA_END=2024 /DNA_ORIENTATION=+